MHFKDMEIIDLTVPRALAEYESHINADGFNFGKPSRVTLTPDKPYKAKVEVPITYKKDTSAGNLYVIAFSNGDGTGNETSYKREEVTIPPSIRSMVSQDHLSRLIPRDKKGVSLEYFFSLFTIYDEEILRNASHLNELSFKTDGNGHKTIFNGGHLGYSLSEFTSHLIGQQASPKIQYTVGTKNGKRIKDPHSIVFPRLITPEITQVAGFLSINDENNPLIEILSGKAEWPIWNSLG